VDEVIAEYLSASSQVSTLKLKDRTDREGEGPVRFTDLEISGSGSTGIRSEVLSGRPMDVVLHFEVDRPMDLVKADFTIVVNDAYQTPLFACATHLHENITSLPRTGRIRFHIPRLPLSAGEYKLRVHCGVNDELSDLIADAGTITVHGGDYFGAGKLPRPERHGVFLVDYDWEIETENHG
jgi:lipopolysaccharide transport system ATP-binding protein